MEERQFHPLDYVSVLRRRMWWFIVPLALCLVVGTLLALLLPREYRTAAEIGVAAPTLSPELLRSVGSLDQGERQRAVSQQLLSRTVLERVVRDEKINPEQPVEQVVGWLRQRVRVEVPQPIGRGERGGIDTFRLWFMDATPERTQRIANRLAYVFAEENSRTTTERAQNTSEVLAQQLAASQERMNDIEGRLRTKKEANMGRLPDQVNSNIQMLNGLRQQHEALSMQIRGEQDQLAMIESQLEGMRQGVGGSSVTATGAAILQSSQGRINQLSMELTQARALGYTDKHPEILRLQEEIKTARAELSSAQKSGDGSENVLQADPLYRQKAAQRDAANLRIATLRRAEAQARAQIGQFQNRVEAAPMVEQDLASLTREHEMEKVRYLDLSSKHQSALMAEELARKQGGERFSVLYPAGLPTRPDSPDIIKLLLMAVAAGLVMGAGMVVLREFLDRSVHDTRALGEYEIPVLGEIPRIHGA